MKNMLLQEKLRKIAEQRKKKEETIDRKQQERENQRLVTAREKARYVGLNLCVHLNEQKIILKPLQGSDSVC